MYLIFFRKTVELCRRAEKAGISWITVHGRTPQQRTEPINMEAIRIIKDSLSIPVVANGDVNSLEDADRIANYCNINGTFSKTSFK